MRRRLEAMDLPQVVTPGSLIMAMLAVCLSAITDNDQLLVGAGFGLLINAAFVRVYNGLRRE